MENGFGPLMVLGFLLVCVAYVPLCSAAALLFVLLSRLLKIEGKGPP